MEIEWRRKTVFVSGHRKVGKVILSEKIDLNKRIDLLRYNKQLLYRWIRRNQAGRPLIAFFLENQLKKIALFYWNEMSELLYYELKNTNIQIVGVIDERDDIDTQVTVYSNIDKLPDVDAIVICTALNSAKIEEELRKRRKSIIFTLDDLL